jgi:hypothetical protein
MSGEGSETSQRVTRYSRRSPLPAISFVYLLAFFVTTLHEPVNPRSMTVGRCRALCLEGVNERRGVRESQSEQARRR